MLVFWLLLSSSHLPPYLSSFSLKMELEIFSLVPEGTFTQLAEKFIHLGNIY